MGTAPQANQNGMTYYYVASKAVAGRMGVGQYTGNGTVLNVDTVGFQPELVMVRKATTSRPWVYKPAATGVNVDYNLFFNDYAGSTLDITQLRPLGFQVTFGLEGAGNDRVNDNGTAYYWVAFGPHAPTPDLLLGWHSGGTAVFRQCLRHHGHAHPGERRLEQRRRRAMRSVWARAATTSQAAPRRRCSRIQDSAANGGTPGSRRHHLRLAGGHDLPGIQLADRGRGELLEREPLEYRRTSSPATTSSTGPATRTGR